MLAVASCLALALRWFSSSAGGISHEVPIAPAISQPVWWYAPFFSGAEVVKVSQYTLVERSWTRSVVVPYRVQVRL